MPIKSVISHPDSVGVAVGLSVGLSVGSSPVEGHSWFSKGGQWLSCESQIGAEVWPLAAHVPLFALHSQLGWLKPLQLVSGTLVHPVHCPPAQAQT